MHHRLAPNRLAHRWSWLIHDGALDDDAFVLHKCDVPACVNPDHLFLGTQADNMADKVTKGRQARGSRVGNAILGDDQYAEILARWARGERNYEIAAAFGVSPQLVHQYVKRNRPLVTN